MTTLAILRDVFIILLVLNIIGFVMMGVVHLLWKAVQKFFEKHA